MNARKRALLFGIDGCRPDALIAAKTPHLDRLIAQGAFHPSVQTGVITISGPNWSDMLTGVWTDKHGVHDNTFAGANYDAYPHLFQRFKEAQPNLKTASIVNWAPINQHILSSADFARECGSDALVEYETLKHLQDADSDFIFLQLDEVDAAGHKHGYAPDSAGYLAAIVENDRIIGAIVAEIENCPDFAEENWLILVSTDHGGSGFGHGQDIPEHRTIFVLAHCTGGATPALPETMHIVDIPLLLAHHFGIEVSPEWEWEGQRFGEEQ